MKKLFNAIRKSDIAEVKNIISNKPDLVNCIAKQPPKKDDGQSPLQVALKTGNFEIAEYLIDMGADLNYVSPNTKTTVINFYKYGSIAKLLKNTID